MGGTESKIELKKSIFKLSSERNIAATDSTFWSKFWQLPDSADDVFSLVSASDIRRIREGARENFVTLVSLTSKRLLELITGTGFPSPFNSVQHLLNCLRILSRLLPFVYEDEELEKDIFWPTNCYSWWNLLCPNWHKHLKAEFLTVLGIFSPKGGNLIKEWDRETGIGASSTRWGDIGPEMKQNQQEVMRFLLTLFSKSMYSSHNENKWLNYFCKNLEKTAIIALLCSLLNTITRYHQQAWWNIPYGYALYNDPKGMHTMLAIQLLLVVMEYPLILSDPLVSSQAQSQAQTQETSTSRRSSLLTSFEQEEELKPTVKSNQNQFQVYFAKLHGHADLDGLRQGFLGLLSKPISNNYLPGANKPLKFSLELLALLWLMMIASPKFQALLIEKHSPELTVMLLYYAVVNRSNPRKFYFSNFFWTTSDNEWVMGVEELGSVRLSCCMLKDLSTRPKFADSLNLPFIEYSKLCRDLRLVTPFNGTYLDFTIIGLHSLITAAKPQPGLKSLYPVILGIIRNLAPFAKGLGVTSSQRLVQMLNIFASPSWLLSGENNHALLQQILITMESIQKHHFKENPNLWYALVRSHKKIATLKTPLALMRKGKGPDNEAKFIPTEDWISSWQPGLRLAAILEMLELIHPKIDLLYAANPLTTDQQVLRYLQSEELAPLIANITIITSPPVGFEWSSNARLWLRGLIWGQCYVAGRERYGVWNGTQVKLFQIKSNTS